MDDKHDDKFHDEPEQGKPNEHQEESKQGKQDKYQEEPEQARPDILDDFEVTRGEFYSHTREPGFTLNDGKVQVNTACIRKMADVDYIQILINRMTHKLAIRACGEEDLFCLPWVRVKEGKRYPRPITGRIFIMKVCKLMNWNPDNRIRMLGKFYKANDDLIFLFDMDGAEEYPRVIGEDGKRKSSKTPHFSAALENVFGPLYSEHKKEMGINLHQGFAIYSVKDGVLRPRNSRLEKGADTDVREIGSSDHDGNRSEEEPPENP